jgi:hypothetical protein
LFEGHPRRVDPPLPRAVGLVWAEALTAPALLEPAPHSGVADHSSPGIPAPAAAAFSSETVAVRTSVRPAASPQSESLIDRAVASIMRMKIKHIPALLVNAPSLAPGPCEAAASPPIRKAERRSAWSERRCPPRRVPVASLLSNLASFHQVGAIGGQGLGSKRVAALRPVSCRPHSFVSSLPSLISSIPEPWRSAPPAAEVRTARR